MLRGLLGPGKGRGAETPEDSAQRTRKLLIAVVVVLVIAAALSAALTSGSPTGISACTSIILQQQRINCISTLANSTLNVSVCGYLPGQQHDSCVMYIAEQKGAASDCSMIARGSAYYNSCELSLANRTGNSSLCYNVTDNYSESNCLYNIAQSGGFSSLSLCDSMRNGTLSSDCKDVYYFKTAVSSKRQSYCLNLPATYDSGALYAVVSSTQNQSLANSNSSLLAYSNANITARDYCYYTLAAETGNKSICGATSGQYASELCLSSFQSYNQTNSTSNSTTVCSRLPSYLVSSCTYSIEESNAIVARNVTDCLSIPDQQYSDACVMGLASQYNDSAYCTQLTNSTLQQICYSTS